MVKTITGLIAILVMIILILYGVSLLVNETIKQGVLDEVPRLSQGLTEEYREGERPYQQEYYDSLRDSYRDSKPSPARDYSKRQFTAEEVLHNMEVANELLRKQAARRAEENTARKEAQ